MLPIDCHIHIVGNGARGSGCWLRLKGRHRWLAAFMLRHLRLPPDLDAPDFDEIYVERLLALVRESSLGSAVILAQEQVYDDRGSLMEGAGSFHVPNEYVLSLARQHPEFIPAVSIHPGRPDAMEELERCLAGGAAMLKLLPNCHNVNCNDRRYTHFWERMAEAGLPFLAHTGGENTVPVIRREYEDPRVLELPLQCGVTVIAAHCATRSGFTDPDYFTVFAEMTTRYPKLYGDNSAFNLPMRGWPTPQAIREPLRFADDLRQRFSGADHGAVVVGARIHRLADLSPLGAPSQCPGTGLSVEAGDGLFGGEFYQAALAARRTGDSSS